MPETKRVKVASLKLDLANFRTVQQPNEASAVQAMTSIDPDWFWALMESLLDNGYLPTENVIVLKKGHQLVVKEGNRRVAALKLIHGQLAATGIMIPPHLVTKISALPPSWKRENSTVPCTIYPAAESATVDRIVTLTHGKAEKAGRHPWNTVARARHNREMSKVQEPALDLLEKYLASGQKPASGRLTPDSHALS